jgi:hypothetical protein
MKPNPMILLLILGGCGASTAESEETTPPPPATADPVPDQPPAHAPQLPRALALVDRANEWCRDLGDECAVYASPEQHPGRVAHGETGGLISDIEGRLAELGHALAWNGSEFRLQAEIDTDLLVGGNFGPDHIGPDAHEALLARVEASPGALLDVFEVRVRGVPDDVALAVLLLGGWHPTNLLERCRQHDPHRVASIASALVIEYDALLGDPSVWSRVNDPDGARVRMRQRRDALQALVR